MPRITADVPFSGLVLTDEAIAGLVGQQPDMSMYAQGDDRRLGKGTVVEAKRHATLPEYVVVTIEVEQRVMDALGHHSPHGPVEAIKAEDYSLGFNPEREPDGAIGGMRLFEATRIPFKDER